MNLKKEKPDALLLDAGDNFQGTYWYTLLKWNVTQRFINMLPNDAHAIGNHEFDDGVAGLAPYLTALKAPVLAANMDTSAEPALKGLYVPHVVLERSSRKIGIIGLASPETKESSRSEGVIFFDPIETVKKEAQQLSDEGVGIIIVLSHCGLNVDIEMAKTAGDYLDIIVGGHTHSLLLNGTLPKSFVGPVVGPYPIIVYPESKSGHKVLIVATAGLSTYLGNLTAYFDEEGEVQSYDGNPVFLDRSIPEDPEIKALLQPYKAKLHSLVNEVVGYSSAEAPDRKVCGSEECFLGDLAADAFLNATLEEYHTDLASVAFVMANIIRAPLPKGSMKLVLNTTDFKVVSALVKDGNQYEPLDPDQEYQVTTIDFLLNEHNDYTVLKGKLSDVRIIGNDAGIFEEYIRKVTPLTPTLDHRLTIVY